MENPFLEINNRLDEVLGKVNQVLDKNLNADGLDKDEFFLIDQAADYLGVKKSTIYTYTRTRKIRHYKRATNIYFKKSELNDYILKGLVEEKSAKNRGKII